nr:ribbon-helix-helix protein, CopG family [Desulfobulbaceae bacterium]
MATQMIIRVESNLKNKVSRLAKAEGKNLSELVRELLEKYTKERDMGAYIDSLWVQIGRNLSKNNIKDSDIEKVIKQVRSKNA